MTRGDEQAGDKLTISTVAGATAKSYPLAPLPQNVTYDTISLQPEAQPNQPVSVPISFHGGLAFDQYDEETWGCLVNTGILANTPGVLRAPVKVNTTTLAGAAAPVMYMFEESAPSATIGKDTATFGTAAAQATLTIAHTTGAGADRYLVVRVASDTTAYPTSVTFDGTACTRKGSEKVGTSRVSFYVLLNPDASTTANVVITYAAASNIAAGVQSYSNVNQATPTGTYAIATATADAGPATVNAASATLELVIDAALCDVAGATTLTVGAGQTQEFNQTVDTITCAGSWEAGAASVTMSWTLGAAAHWAVIAVALKPSSSPVLYANSVEEGETNIRKVSLDDSNFGTLLNTKTFTGVTTKPMGRPAKWTSGGNTYWRQPLGDNNGIETLTAIASGTDADTWSGGTDAYGRHLCVVKNKLYRTGGPLSPDNEVNLLAYNADPETEANWTGNWYIGDAGYTITDIGSVAGIASIPKEDGVWMFDGVAEASNILPELGIAERNGQGLSFGRGGFFYPGVASLYWGYTGQPIGPDSFDDRHTANDPSVVSGQYFKHGRWNGTASYNGHLYGLYVNSLGTSALVVWAYPVGERWRWQAIASVTGDFNDFHGIHVAETSKFSATEVRPCLFFANGNDLSWIWLDKNGAPMLRRGDIDLHTTASVISGRIDFGMPRVNKQLTYISGWIEDFAATASHHIIQLRVFRDGGTYEGVGAVITGDGTSPDGYFTNWWTPDTLDECRSLLFEVLWAATDSLTDQNGPLIRDIQIHAIAKPATTRLWGFLISAKDDTSRSATTIRSDLEGYLNDLKKFKFPHEAAFNGMLTGLQLLRADEINALTPRGQAPPHFVFRATVREMPSS